MPKRTKEERHQISELGRPIGYDLAFMLELLAARLQPGMTGKHVDAWAALLIKDMGYQSSCLGYHGFPASICVSPNEIVVHGVPNDKPFKEGDIVKLDMAINKDGVHADAAVTVPVGRVSDETRKLMHCSYEALMSGMAAARPGNKLSDVTAAIDAVVQFFGFKAYPDFGGHGIGHQMHETPFISNVVGRGGADDVLEEDQMICLEPIVTTGDGSYTVDSDGWTVRGKGLSAQFEHTIRVSKLMPEPYTEWEPKFFERMFGFKK